MLDPKERFNRQAETLEHEYDRLFQRLNFFLIGTTFIITAFATVVALKRDNLNLLAHLICGAGYYLAIFFTLTNYLNSKVIELWSKRLNEIEVTCKYIPGMKAVIDKIFDEIAVEGLIVLFIRELGSVIVDPFGSKEHPPGRHTWLVPLSFAFFWGLVWRILPATQEWKVGNFRILVWPHTFFIWFMPIVLLTILLNPNRWVKWITTGVFVVFVAVFGFAKWSIVSCFVVLVVNIVSCILSVEKKKTAQ